MKLAEITPKTVSTNVQDRKKAKKSDQNEIYIYSLHETNNHDLFCEKESDKCTNVLFS